MADGDIKIRTIISGTTVDGDAVKAFDESKTWSSVADVFERTLTVPTTLSTLLSIGTVAGATLASMRALVVQNLDSTNYVTLGVLAANGAAYFRINPGEIFILTDDQLEAFAAATVFSAFETITSVNLQANTAAVKCRVVGF